MKIWPRTNNASGDSLGDMATRLSPEALFVAGVSISKGLELLPICGNRENEA